MGMDVNFFKEENITKNLELYSDLDNKKRTILFSSEKEEKKIQKNSLNNSITFLEDINKSTKTDSIIEIKSDKVKFKFEYKPDIKYNNRKIEVLLVGSFLNNWDNFIIMEKNAQSQNYEYETYLSKKIHYFKFIVNNKWLCSDLYPSIYDESNNLNNFIDLTNYENEEKKNEINDTSNICASNEIIIKYPELKILNRKAPRLLYNKKKLLLDMNSKKRDKFSYIEKNNIYCYANINNSYKKVSKLENENIGHLMQEINDNMKDRNYRKISATERNRNKLLTVVYYIPK